MKGLKSENADISFILQEKTDHPQEVWEQIRKNDSNSWLGHKNIVSCPGFLEITILTYDFSAKVSYTHVASNIWSEKDQENNNKTVGGSIKRVQYLF